MKKNMYEDCKILIENNRYNYDNMINNINIFLKANKLTQEEYDELNLLMKKY